MKHLITILLGLFAVLNMNAQEPQMKFYLNDGTERTYLISEVEEMNFIKSDVFAYMSIYFTDSTKRNFDTKSIEKMEIVEENELLSVYTCGYPYNYEISTIDSIIFGYDIENLYETVTIGEQVWMQYNLDVCHYRNGDPIPNVQDSIEWAQLTTGAWCYYDNDPENGKIYAKLYNWYAVNDPRGLAPEGWRVPSDDDWIALELELGMTQKQADSLGWRGRPVATKLAGGYDLWRNGDLRNHNDFNSSGYLGIPGGYRWIDGSFGFILNTTGWWSSTADSIESAKNRSLGFGFTSIFRHNFIKHIGFSVRCIRDK